MILRSHSKLMCMQGVFDTSAFLFSWGGVFCSCFVWLGFLFGLSFVCVFWWLVGFLTAQRAQFSFFQLLLDSVHLCHLCV